MRILGIDFETAGTRQSGHFRAVEVGFCIYNTDMMRFERMSSYLVNDLKINRFDPNSHDYYEIPEEVTKIHGIKTEHCVEMGQSLDFMIADLVTYNFYDIDAIMVWNGYFFDVELLHNILDAYKDKFNISEVIDLIPIIDLKLDCNYKYRLDHEAADRGILSFGAHSALADVVTMFRLAIADKFDFKKYTEKATSPFLAVFADVTYQRKDEAKKQNFKFSGSRKKWYRIMRQSDYDLEQENWTFQTTWVVADGFLLDELLQST